MRIFALETNVHKIVEQFCTANECVILLTFFHPFYFLSIAVRELFVTALLIAAGFGGWYLGADPRWAAGLAATAWTAFALPRLIKAFIDWRYDFMLVTTDKVVLVDQSSIFHRQVKPVHIENIGSVDMKTQWLGIFNFGAIYINLKEGESGEPIIRKYVPHVTDVASKMSSAVTSFQRGSFEDNDKHRLKNPAGQNKWTTQAQINNELMRKREEIENLRKELEERKATAQ